MKIINPLPPGIQEQAPSAPWRAHQSMTRRRPPPAWPIRAARRSNSRPPRRACARARRGRAGRGEGRAHFAKHCRRPLQGECGGDRRQADRQRAGIAGQSSTLKTGTSCPHPPPTARPRRRKPNSKPRWPPSRRGSTALGVALLESNAPEIDAQASELHRALARAVEHFSHAARNGVLPAPLRERLMRASSQVAAQRESFARATAALDRAIDVLMPSDAPALYSAQGAAERSRRGGAIQA